MSKVLVIDDLPTELQLLSNYVSQGGHQVMTAVSAADALEKIEIQRPDVIVTDLVMPDMSGLDMCRKLKKDDTTANIPIIACTTKDGKMDRNWAIKQGVNIYLTKPCEKADLLDAIKSVAG
ncbi:response regulator [Synechococcus moorigangaii CMS01]|nr:response regulator [Synechococcus moorigangaii CMS01]